MYFSYYTKREKEGLTRRIVALNTIKDITVTNDGSSVIDRDGEWHLFNKEDTEVIVNKLEEQGLIFELGNPRFSKRT